LPVWTQNKARLIREYLYLFVLLTRHGNYIDGFAGPQEDQAPGMWAAKLVLDMRPAWLRKFFLFEKDPVSFKLLEELKQVQPSIPNRTIEVHHGDFNVLVHSLLASGKIKPREATFSLLDQRTFECQWATVEALARHRKTGHKIELFYFLAASWFDRAVSGLKDREAMIRPWWGRDDWAEFLKLTTVRRSDAVVARFRSELGYRYVVPWPIYNRERSGGRVMYYMIHASDHPQAPEFMGRAYEAAVRPLPPEQPSLLSDEPKTQGYKRAPHRTGTRLNTHTRGKRK
jgi:three-Cys-motif partner protein